MVPKEESAFGVRGWAVVGRIRKMRRIWEKFLKTTYLTGHSSLYMDFRSCWELILYFKNLCWVTFYPIRLRTTGPIPTHPPNYPSNPPCFQSSAQPLPQIRCHQLLLREWRSQGDYSQVAIICPKPHIVRSWYSRRSAWKIITGEKLAIFPPYTFLFAPRVKSFQMWKRT